MSDDSDQEETVKYGELEYWEERYGGWAQSPYDWLFEWKHVRHVCKEFLQTTDLIMQPGCGNAPFSAHMYEDGYENQINIDTSTEAIKKMLELHSESCPKAEWLIKDATATGYPDEHFDAVVDKSLIDTTVCGQDGEALTHRFVKEMHRILKTNGIYITMTLHTWEEICKYFKCTASYKMAATAIVVNNPDFNKDMPDQKEDAPSLKCFAVAKKLANDATPEQVEQETKRLAEVLAPHDDTWMDPEQVAAKKKAVLDEGRDHSGNSNDFEAEPTTDEKATVEDVTHCLRRIHQAQKSGALTVTEYGQIKDMLLDECTKCTVDAIIQVLDEKEGSRSS